MFWVEKKYAPANPSVLWLIGIGYCTSTSAEALGLSWGVLFSVSQDEQLERVSHENHRFLGHLKSQRFEVL